MSEEEIKNSAEDSVVEAPREKTAEEEVSEWVKEIKKLKAEKEEQKEKKKEEKKSEAQRTLSTHIFALRTTANREDQVMDFISSNIKKKNLPVYAIIKPHGMRGYIFMEADDQQSAEQAAFNVPYARGILPKEIDYREIEHMLEQTKKEVDIRKNDIVEIISGPYKREQAKITRVDQTKEKVVVELLGAAVPIPITVNLDSVKVIRRESEETLKHEDTDTD